MSEGKTIKDAARGAAHGHRAGRDDTKVRHGEVTYSRATTSSEDDALTKSRHERTSAAGDAYISGRRGTKRSATHADGVPRTELEALRRQVEALTERVDDLEDALDAQAARAVADPADDLPAELVARLIAGESPVRIWREQRGLSLTELAKRAELPQGYLSEIEHRKKPGSVRAMRAIARALAVDLDDLVREPEALTETEAR